MTATLEIITDAYRESNLISIGVALDENQKAEGLRRLNAVISSALGFEIGEELVDWQVGTTNISAQGVGNDQFGQFNTYSEGIWTRPVENSRLLLNAQSPQTLFLPTKPNDGARMQAIDQLGTLATYPVTLDANGQRIEGAPTLVLNTNDLNKIWFYRADLGNWVPVATLLIDDEMPFPPEFDDSFVTTLAMRINPRYGRAISQETAAWLQRSMAKLKARYKQRRVTPADIGVLNLTRPGYNRYGYYGRRGWMS